MRKIKSIKIVKSENNSGGKCKTYLLDFGDVLVFYKYTLYALPREGLITLFVGGEEVIRETSKYVFTFHYFSIKKSTLKKLKSK
jgi:hypothetical protein